MPGSNLGLMAASAARPTLRRHRLGVGSRLELVDAGDHLVAWPASVDPVSRLRGLLTAGPGEESLIDALMETRAAERATSQVPAATDLPEE